MSEIEEKQSISDSSEIKITANLVFEKNLVDTIEKIITFQEDAESSEQNESNNDESNDTTISIDEIATQLLEQIIQSADKLEFQISKEEIVKITANIIIFIIKQTEKEITLDVNLDKKTEPEPKEKETDKDNPDGN